MWSAGAYGSAVFSLEDKRTALTQLREALDAEVARGTRQARDAAEAATHEDNRPEGDKDMRSTEASYIARGQAARVAEVEEARILLAAMPVKSFEPGAAIEASAIVNVEQGKRNVLYFIVAGAGGQRLEVAGKVLMTLTTVSPLGRALLGLSEGDEAEVSTPQGVRHYVVLGVW